MQVADSLTNGRYGLGYGVFPTLEGGERRVGHVGSNPGMVSYFVIFPDSHDGLVVLTNSSSGSELSRGLSCCLIEWKVGSKPSECKHSIGSSLLGTILDKGSKAAVDRYRRLRESQANRYDFSERQLIGLGTVLFRKERVEDAIDVFRLNLDNYPASFRSLNGLADAYAAAGQPELAIKIYKESLRLNPEDQVVKKKLEKLLEQK